MMTVSRAQMIFSFYYAAQYVLLGVQLPFFAAWLAARDFSAADIGWMTGAALAARLIFGPFVAVWADRQADPRRALRYVSAAFALAALLLCIEPGKALIFTAGFLVIFTFGLLVPLSDSAVLQADRAGALHYGQTRAFGSFAFLATNIAGGAVLAVFGLDWSVLVMGAAAAATYAISLILPTSGPRFASAAAVSQVWRTAPRLVMSPPFLLMIGAAGLVQGGHAVYYAFSILHWSEIGYSPMMIGVLWATGVAFEIGLLMGARGLARRLSPVLLIAMGAAGAVLRWSVTAGEPPLGVLFVMQSLHALTFAAAYLGSIEFIDRAVPKQLISTAMTLSSTTGIGAITGLATVIAGYVFDAHGAGAAYLMMAAMGAGALVFCLLLAKAWRGQELSV